MDKEFEISNLAYLEEDNRLEAKLTKKSVPESVWETYSSFANTNGGVILLGVEEQSDHSLRAVGVEDSHKIIADFWNISEAALQGGTSDPRNSIIMNMFGLVGIGDRAGTGMPDAIATMRQELGADVRYSVSLEPERTTLSIVMDVATSDKTRDKTKKQGINTNKTRDKVAKQGINIRLVEKTSDKIERIEGISKKTRDNLLIMLEYLETHPSVKNHEIAELLSVSDDRARVLLLLLVDNGLLIAKGDRKERTYHLLNV